MQAVITADLIASTRYSRDLLSKVIERLKKEFKNIEKEFSAGKENFRIYRGDSFQGVLQKPENVLRIALRLKCAVISTSQDTKGTREADVKIAVGIGSLDFEGASVEESNGQAFQLSGRTLEFMKNEARTLRLTTPNEDINAEFNASLFLLDMLTDRWSIASAEVIYYLLMDWKEKAIAKELGISQPAVNQRKKTAGWEAVAALLERYQDITKKTFGND